MTVLLQEPSTADSDSSDSDDDDDSDVDDDDDASDSETRPAAKHKGPRKVWYRWLSARLQYLHC